MAKMVRFENIGGRHEVCAILDITNAALTKLIAREDADFPQPVAVIKSGPVFDLQSVRDWKARDSRARRQSIVSAPVATGTALRHVNRDGSVLVATVTADGYEFDGKVYPSPSAAGMAAAGYPVNGWTYWSTDDGASLDSLRTA